MVTSAQHFFPSSRKVSLFYTTGLSPDNFLLQYIHDQSVTLRHHDAHLSLSVPDHVLYHKDQEVKGKKKHCYTYLIEIEPTKKVIAMVNKIEASSQYIFSHYRQLLSSTSISLDQMYFVDSNDRAFETQLLPLLNTKNIKLDTVKQFPLDQKLKRKIREFTAQELWNSEKRAVDLQEKALCQLQSLEASRNAVFGTISRETELTAIQPFDLLKVSDRELVQLSVLTWLNQFIQAYEKNPEYSTKMLLENKKLLLSQICSHIEEGRYKPYNDSEHIPSTLPSLEFLFMILKKSYAENHITKRELLDFLLPREKEDTPTCFIIEKYYYLPVAQSYIYLLSQILTERSLHSEVFLRMYKCISCKHSPNSATFLCRLKRGIKSAKLDWKFYEDARGITNLYPLLLTLDACRRNDIITLSQRIAMIFSINKIPLKKVLEAFYKLENRMKKKNFFPVDSEESILSLYELAQKLKSQKEMYSKILQECRTKNKEAQANRIKQKEKEIADLEKLIEEAEGWKADDDFDPFAIFTVGFCTLFRPEDIESMKRNAYSAKQDALREWERWERDQRASRSYEQAHPLGLLGLFAPLGAAHAQPKESQASALITSKSVVSDHHSIPSEDELIRRFQNLKSEKEIDADLRRRLENLRSGEVPKIDVDLRRRLENLRS